MALSIKRAATERKVRLLAERTGASLTDAIDRAVEERLQTMPQDHAMDAARLAEPDAARLARWRALMGELPPVAGGAGNWRDELYDESGLPR
jgi:antitoxin VapB